MEDVFVLLGVTVVVVWLPSLLLPATESLVMDVVLVDTVDGSVLILFSICDSSRRIVKYRKLPLLANSAERNNAKSLARSSLVKASPSKLTLKLDSLSCMEEYPVSVPFAV